MAKMTFKLPEETMRKMEALGSHYDAVTSAVLEEGVKPLYDAAKQSLSSVIGQGTKEPSESTGDLLESLSVTKPYQSADGNWNIKVGCIGYDRKGVPNPLKAAVLEHGRSNQPAKPWAKPAGRKAKKECIKKMQEALRRWLKMARSITVIPAKQISTAESGTAQSVQKLKMAAYCRVSTDQEEQLLSYENQVNYYTNYISENPLYEYAGTYADEGISGTNTKKRDEFNRMIADCRAGKIDMIITKSISRFARNTLDCLNYVRELKDLGIGIIFEKENINTLDAKGEVLLTILSSLAQDESRSISENCTWGIRRRFETGKHKMSTKRFLGYDTDENGKLVINRMQESIVVRLYQEFLDGKTTDYIKRIFEKEGVRNWDGGTKWQATTLMSMLENEKYKGDALLQKSYTVDFLTKKRTQNKGEIQMFYVEDDHDAIISKRIWECVQLEIKRRKKYLEEHGTNSYSHRPGSNPFASKIICGDCNKVFARKGWRSSTGVDRKVWQCSERYKVKGVVGCTNRHVEEETLVKAYLLAWNALVENRESFLEWWQKQIQGEDLLAGYRAEKFMEYTDGVEPLVEMDTNFMLKTLDHIKVFEDGVLVVVFLDGTEIECK